ncbi:MAG: MATE family efflux transporter [Ruminococcaceae bacterium]|nr:MATE family efflux transporter [Oscillospiraceae bacterium]
MSQKILTPADREARQDAFFSRRTLIRLLIPLIIEQILNATVGMADTLMVSSVGEAAVSGISLVDTINILVIGFQMSVAIGGTVIVAQYIGRGDRENAASCSRQLLHAMFLLGTLLGALCFVFNRPLLSLIFGKAEEAVMANARDYFFYSALSYPFAAIFSTGSALFRARGNTSISMLANLFANILNVAGNAILIYGFEMGAAGAAIATLFARIFGAAVILVLVLHPRSPFLIESFFRPAFRKEDLSRMFRVGLPNGADAAMFDIGKMLLVSLVTVFGTASIAANQIGNKIAYFSQIPAMAVSVGMTTVVGQCIGANRPDEAVRYTRNLLLFSTGSLVLTNSVIFLFAEPMIRLFNLSEEAVAIAVDMIRVHCFTSTILWPAAFNTAPALRAAGDSRFTMIVSTLSMWFFRVGGSYIIALWLGQGVKGVWYAMYIDWACRTICYLTRFFRQKWRKYQLI